MIRASLGTTGSNASTTARPTITSSSHCDASAPSSSSRSSSITRSGYGQPGTRHIGRKAPASRISSQGIPLDDALAGGRVDDLGTPPHVELVAQVPHVELDGRLADHEPPADLAVGHPDRQQPQHLVL